MSDSSFSVVFFFFYFRVVSGNPLIIYASLSKQLARRSLGVSHSNPFFIN